jgi:hypothetical protein
MEANSLIHKPKRQKLNEEQGIDGNSKCFGNLPDAILRHILSFLHIKYAARTSVLSKRWEFLWTSIPCLNFGKPLPAKRTLHMNFVERVLCLRDSSDIKELTLNCDVQGDASRVKSWITAAVRRNVQSLHICLSDLRGQFSLPHRVFTCETLESFFLDMPCILKVPPIICFSNLKVLSIQSVTFSDDYTTQQFFSGLPVLEMLFLEECRWGCLKVLSICAPKLHSLVIREADILSQSDSDGCQVTVFGASLKEFFYTGEFFNEYWLYNSFSVERAEIDVSYSDKRARQVSYRMFKVLTGLPNVKDLRLYCSAVEVRLLLSLYFVYLMYCINIVVEKLSPPLHFL